MAFYERVFVAMKKEEDGPSWGVLRSRFERLKKALGWILLRPDEVLWTLGVSALTSIFYPVVGFVHVLKRVLADPVSSVLAAIITYAILRTCFDVLQVEVVAKNIPKLDLGSVMFYLQAASVVEQVPLIRDTFLRAAGEELMPLVDALMGAYTTILITLTAVRAAGALWGRAWVAALELDPVAAASLQAIHIVPEPQYERTSDGLLKMVYIDISRKYKIYGFPSQITTLQRVAGRVNEAAMPYSVEERIEKTRPYILAFESADGQVLAHGFRVGNYLFTAYHAWETINMVPRVAAVVCSTGKRFALDLSAWKAVAKAVDLDVVMLSPPANMFAMMGLKAGQLSMKSSTRACVERKTESGCTQAWGMYQHGNDWFAQHGVTTDASVSGAPVMNPQGKILALHVGYEPSKVSPERNVNVALPAVVIKAMLKESAPESKVSVEEDGFHWASEEEARRREARDTKTIEFSDGSEVSLARDGRDYWASTVVRKRFEGRLDAIPRGVSWADAEDDFAAEQLEEEPTESALDRAHDKMFSSRPELKRESNPLRSTDASLAPGSSVSDFQPAPKAREPVKASSQCSPPPLVSDSNVTSKASPTSVAASTELSRKNGKKRSRKRKSERTSPSVPALSGQPRDQLHNSVPSECTQSYKIALSPTPIGTETSSQ